MEYVLMRGENEKEILVYSKKKSKWKNNKLSYMESMAYDDFKKRFMARDSIEKMELENGVLIVDSFSYSEEEKNYGTKKHVIHFSADLLQDADFKSVIEEIKMECDKFSEEVKNRKETIETIISYFKNGNFGDSINKKSFSMFREYVINNKEEIMKILDNSVLKIRHPLRNLLYQFTIVLGEAAEMIAKVSVIYIIFSLVILAKFDISIMLKIFTTVLVSSLPFSIFASSKFPKTFRNVPLEKLYNELVDEIEKAHRKTEDLEFLLDEKETQQDIYLSYIKKVTMFMKNVQGVDFSNEVSMMYNLVFDYSKAKKDEQTSDACIDKFEFLRRLSKLELAIYSKIVQKNNTNGVSLKASMISGVDDKLKFLGIPSSIDDDYLGDVFEDIKQILAFPYEGCEKDIEKLLAAAREYVENSQQFAVPEVLGLTSASMLLNKKLSVIEPEIDVKIKNFIASMGLNSDLSTIENCVGALRMTSKQSENDAALGIESTKTPLQM